MLIHPNFDPVALAIGPIAIRWYGLMYLVAFVAFVLLCRLHARRLPELGWHPRMIDDVLFFGVIGVIVGGRLGYVLFYKPVYYASHLAEIPAVWQGGMSFHGGFLGVLAAMWWYARSRRLEFWSVMDFIAPAVPLGLASGRLGNFINGELWGRATTLPWGMVFPQAGDGIARHPSQLYQFALEGVALFVVLWVFARRPRPAGAVSGLFLSGYGLFRFIAEFAREPDAFLGLLALGMTMGQWLSVPMILAGIGLMVWSSRRTGHLPDARPDRSIPAGRSGGRRGP
ncbi:MAG: prolipoprotein diacylglyceryl transferase [Burkholderiales bacterium]|nr:prolipoprotein diacylglyceryl transferase [Burkholderiales bacterium]